MNPRCASCLFTEGTIPMWGRVVYCRECAAKAGEVGRRAIARHDFGTAPEGYTTEVLQRLANGPIMDSSAIFLPAGKLSMAEYRAREARMLRGEPA